MKEKKDQIRYSQKEMRNNPYKGLRSYEEHDQNNFYGREEEVEELFQLVESNTSVLLFGKSGIGKTSLLNAGLLPKVRKKGFLPVLVLLEYSNREFSLLKKVHSAIQREITCNSIKVKNLFPSISKGEGETLWEYFRRIQLIEYDRDTSITPLLILDHFEELFTIGKHHPDRERFIDELYWLIANQIPPHIRNQIKNRKDISFINTPPNVKVIIGLREDYLPHLTDLKSKIGTIDLVKFRVKHFNGRQAREIIGLPGGFKDKDKVNGILRYFHTGELTEDEAREIPDEELEKMEVEPALLSLLCYQFFEKKEMKPGKIESQERLLAEFYVSVMKNYPERLENFIESRLLTEGGFRTPFYLAPDMDQTLRDLLEKLVKDRILRRFYDGQREHIEIIHDVLTPVIREKRDRRKRRAQNWIMLALACLALVFFILAILTLYQKNRADNELQNVQELNVAAEASLELPHDNTEAMEIATRAYAMGLPDPLPRTSQVLSAVAYSSYNQPFYIAAMKSEEPVNAATISKDGHLIVTASESGIAKIWNEKGQFQANLKGHKARVLCAAVSPDNQLVVTGSWDRTAKGWSTDGKHLFDLLHEGIVESAVFAPDGSRILTASRDFTAKLWNTKGELQQTLKHDGPIFSALFSPDGTMILTASWDKSARLWDQFGKLIVTFPHESALCSAMFSGEEKQIFTASKDGIINLWDLHGNLLLQANNKEPVIEGTLSPDGKIILTASETGTVKLWNFKLELLTEIRQKEPVTSIVFSPDSLTFVTAFKSGSLRIWNTESKILKDITQHKKEITSTRFSIDGSRLLTASKDGTAILWDMETQFLVDIAGHEADVTKAAFSPGDKLVVTASRDGTAEICDAKTGKLLNNLDHKGIVYSAVFSLNGYYILTASEDGKAKLWDSKTGQLIKEMKHNRAVYAAKFSPDSRSIVTASLDQTARLWNLKPGSDPLAFYFHEAAVYDAAFSPDGALVITSSADGTAKLWKRGEAEAILTLKHQASVRAGIFSPDGNLILTVPQEGGAILWDENGTRMATFDQQGIVSSAVFSPDGTRILTASHDGSARLWNTKGELIYTFSHKGPVSSAEFSMKGDRIITASFDNTAKYWNLDGDLLADLNKHKGDVTSAVFSLYGNRILTTSEGGAAKIWFTPEAIYKYLKSSF